MDRSTRPAGSSQPRIVCTRWQWRVTYKKFRGRGQGAPEKETGADGVFQVEVRPGETFVIVPKGVLFQAKKVRGSGRSALIDQVEEMERIAPGGSAVFQFGPNGYIGVSGRDILVTTELSPRKSLILKSAW